MSADNIEHSEADLICHILIKSGLKKDTILNCLYWYNKGLHAAMLNEALGALRAEYLRIVENGIEVLRAVEEKQNSNSCSH